MAIRMFFLLYVSFFVLQSCLAPVEEHPVNSITIGGADSIPANGISTIDIKASMPIGGSKGSKITFVTDNGTFYGTNPAGGKTIDVNDPDDTAHVTLVSSTSVGDARITATANNYSVSKLIHFTTSYPEFCSFTASPYSFKADGATACTITVTLSKTIGSVSNHFPIRLYIQDTLNAKGSPGIDLPPIIYTEDKGVATTTVKSISTDTAVFRIKAVYNSSSSRLDSQYVKVTLKGS
jgi:hypothetical protein